MRENPINMDDLGVPLFQETPICWFITLINYIDSSSTYLARVQAIGVSNRLCEL